MVDVFDGVGLDNLDAETHVTGSRCSCACAVDSKEQLPPLTNEKTNPFYEELARDSVLSVHEIADKDK